MAAVPGPDKIEIVLGKERDGTALYTAMGAALVGTLLGGVAVYMGLQGRAARMANAGVAATETSSTSKDAAATPSYPPPPRAATQDERPEASASPPPKAGLAAVAGPTLESVVCLSFDPDGNEPSFAGAGVIYDESGLVLTNHHVVEPMLRQRGGSLTRLGSGGRLSARFMDGRVRDATVLLNSPEEDLAILQLEGEPSGSALRPATFGRSGEVAVGETVFAVGCPVGLEHSVSAGIVSALHRTGVMPNPHLPTIQLDAAINLGNSGGPLFDAKGRLVGITSARSSRGQGIGFAIPIDRVRVYLTALYEGEAGRSGVIGAVVSAAPEIDEAIGALGYEAGLTIEQVDADGPAQRAGLMPNDVIVEVRGRRYDGTTRDQPARVEFLRDFMNVARNLLPGEELELTLARRGERVPVRIVVQAATDAEQAHIDVEAVLGLRLYDRDAPVVLAFVPGSRLEGNRQAQRMLLDHRITVVGTRKIETIDDLGRVAATLKPLLAEGRGRKVRMRLESEKGEVVDVTYPLDWRR